MSHGFIPYITRPTRITEYTATLIDHIFIRLPHCKIAAPVRAGVLFNDMTDHLPISIFLLDLDKMQCTQRSKVRLFNDKNIQKLMDKIGSTNLYHVLNHASGMVIKTALNFTTRLKSFTQIPFHWCMFQENVTKSSHK